MANESNLPRLPALLGSVETSIKEYIRSWLTAGGIEEFVKSKGLETDEAIMQIMNQQDTKRPALNRQVKATGEAVTIEMLRLMTDEKNFDDNWHDDGKHCVYFLGGRSAPRNGKTHTFCGVEDDIACKDHMKTVEGKRISEEHKTGKFDMNSHKDACRKKRVAYAQKKLKEAEGTTATSTLSTLIRTNKVNLKTINYELDRNLRFIEKNGLLVKKDTDDRWVAIGFATSPSSEINKLSIKDMDALTEMSLTAEDDSMSPEARAYVETKRATQESSKQTFTPTRGAGRATSALPTNGDTNNIMTRRRPPAKTNVNNDVIETPSTTSLPSQRMPTSQERRSIQATPKPVMPGDEPN